MGVTVESAEYLDRLDSLCEVPATVRFVSFEPLLRDLKEADLTGIDWVIAGGESGPGARPMKPAWARGVRDRCVQLSIPFFFKQWCGFNKKANGRELDGRTWDEWPDTRPGDHQATGRKRPERGGETALNLGLVEATFCPNNRGKTESHAPQLV
jgi:protein gp37